MFSHVCLLRPTIMVLNYCNYFQLLLHNFLLACVCRKLTLLLLVLVLVFYYIDVIYICQDRATVKPLTSSETSDYQNIFNCRLNDYIGSSDRNIRGRLFHAKYSNHTYAYQHYQTVRTSETDAKQLHGIC